MQRRNVPERVCTPVRIGRLLLLLMMMMMAEGGSVHVGRSGTIVRTHLLWDTLRRKDGAETETLGAETGQDVGAVLVGVVAVVLLVGSIHGDK